MKELNTPGKKNAFKKAVNYMLDRWHELTQFCKDGMLEIENKIRPIALGRKNFMFAENHEAAQDNAMIYSLLATCKQHDVNPEDWLIFVLERITDWPINRIEELLPQNFKTHQSAAWFGNIIFFASVVRCSSPDAYRYTTRWSISLTSCYSAGLI